MASKKSSRKSRKKTPTRRQRPVQAVGESAEVIAQQQPVVQNKALQESTNKTPEQEKTSVVPVKQAETTPEPAPYKPRRQQFWAVGISAIIMTGLIIGVGAVRNHNEPEFQQASSSVLKADQVLQDGLTDGGLGCGSNAIQQGPAPQSSTQQLQNVPVNDLQTSDSTIGVSSNQASQSLQPAGCL